MKINLRYNSMSFGSPLLFFLSQLFPRIHVDDMMLWFDICWSNTEATEFAADNRYSSKRQHLIINSGY